MPAIGATASIQAPSWGPAFWRTADHADALMEPQKHLKFIMKDGVVYKNELPA